MPIINEKLQAALGEILSRSVDGIDAGTAFLSSQLPDVIQQLLLWKLVQAAIVSAFFIAALIAAAAGAKWATRIIAEYSKGESLYIKYSDEREREGREIMKRYGARRSAAGLVMPVSIAASIAAIIGIPTTISTALKIWLAPKIYLIEYAASLVK